MRCNGGMPKLGPLCNPGFSHSKTSHAGAILGIHSGASLKLRLAAEAYEISYGYHVEEVSQMVIFWVESLVRLCNVVLRWASP